MVSGEKVHDVNTSLIKLTIGYSSGVMGVAEVTVLATVSNDGTTLLITNSDEFDEGSDSNHIFNKVAKCDANAVVLINSGPGGYDVRSAPKKHQVREPSRTKPKKLRNTPFPPKTSSRAPPKPKKRMA